MNGKLLTILAAFVSVVCRYSMAADSPLNVLILYADDWRYNTLGFAGNSLV